MKIICINSFLERAKDITKLLGQLPNYLEDMRKDVATGKVEKSKHAIDAVPRQCQFEIRYHTIRQVDWESCATKLDATNMGND